MNDRINLFEKEISELDRLSNKIEMIPSNNIKNILHFIIAETYKNISRYVDGDIITEGKSFGNIKYVEIIRFLKYIINHVSNSTTKTVLNELIKVLSKLEFTSVSLVPITTPRYKASKDVIRYAGKSPR